MEKRKRKIEDGRQAEGGAQSAYRGAAFSWQPSEAYLAGKKRNVKKGEKREEEKKE